MKQLTLLFCLVLLSSCASVNNHTEVPVLAIGSTDYRDTVYETVKEDAFAVHTIEAEKSAEDNNTTESGS